MRKIKLDGKSSLSVKKGTKISLIGEAFTEKELEIINNGKT